MGHLEGRFCIRSLKFAINSSIDTSITCADPVEDGKGPILLCGSRNVVTCATGPVISYIHPEGPQEILLHILWLGYHGTLGIALLL
jgi:hypothetical protein